MMRISFAEPFGVALPKAPFLLRKKVFYCSKLQKRAFDLVAIKNPALCAGPCDRVRIQT